LCSTCSKGKAEAEVKVKGKKKNKFSEIRMLNRFAKVDINLHDSSISDISS
jgi:hypothetical protein